MGAKQSVTVLAMFAMLAVGTTAQAGDGADTVKMIPGAAMVVAHVNMERLRGSPLFQDLWKQMMGKNAKDMEQMKAKFGVDLEKDVNGLTLYVPADVDKSQVFAVILDGNFSEDKIVAGIKAEDPKLTTAEHAGQKYYAGGKDGSIAFIGKQLVLAHPTALKAVIDAKAGKGKLDGNKALNALVGKANKGGDIWFAAALTGTAAKEASKGLAKEIPGAEIKTLSGSLDIAKGLGLKLLVGTNSADTAGKIVAELQKGLEEAKKQPGPGAMFGSLLSGLKIGAAGDAVDIDLQMTDQQVAMVKGMLGAFAGMAGAGGPAMPPPKPATPPPSK